MNKLQRVAIVCLLVATIGFLSFMTWWTITGQMTRDFVGTLNGYQALMSTNFTVRLGNNVPWFGVDQVIVRASSLTLTGPSAEGSHIVKIFNWQQVLVNESFCFVNAAQDFTVIIYENGTMTYEIFNHAGDYGL